MPRQDDLDKWISTKAKHGKSQMYYHTVEECRYLQDAKNHREPLESELEWHEAEECDECKRLRNGD